MRDNIVLNMTFEGSQNLEGPASDDALERLRQRADGVYDMSEEDELSPSDLADVDDNSSSKTRGIGAKLRRMAGIGAMGMASLAGGETMLSREAEAQDSLQRVEQVADSAKLAEIRESWKRRDSSEVGNTGRRALELIEFVDGVTESRVKPSREKMQNILATHFPEFIKRIPDLLTDGEYEDVKKVFMKYKYGDLVAINQATERMMEIVNYAEQYRFSPNIMDNLKLSLIRLKFNFKYLVRTLDEIQKMEVKKDTTKPPPPNLGFQRG